MFKCLFFLWISLHHMGYHGCMNRLAFLSVIVLGWSCAALSCTTNVNNITRVTPEAGVQGETNSVDVPQLPRCDEDQRHDEDGICRFSCTYENEATDCEGTQCSSSNLCTDTPVGEKAACSPCTDNSDCAESMRCLRMTMPSSAIGNFCLPVLSGMNNDCESRTPYVVHKTLNTNGVILSYCSLQEALTSCMAINRFRASCMGSEECGPGGLCYGRSGNNPGICTYHCSRADALGDFECLGGKLSACLNLDSSSDGSFECVVN